MDAKTQAEVDDAFRSLAVAYAVLDEAEENQAFAVLLDDILDRRVTDADERELLGLPPLTRAEVLDFKPPEPSQ